MMKSEMILCFGKPQEITTEINRQVWKCRVPIDNMERHSETLNVSNLHNLENDITILQGIAEKHPFMKETHQDIEHAVKLKCKQS